MSKSIKDYKEAMDNVKISESFYKRTEDLLGDMREISLDKKPKFTPRHFTVILTAAAACGLLVFGLRTALTHREGTEDITMGTAVTEAVTAEVTDTVTETAAPLIEAVEDGGDMLTEKEYEYDEADDDVYVGESRPTEEKAMDAGGQPEAAGAGNAGTKTPAVTTAPADSTTVRTEQDSAVTVPVLSDISYENVTVEITPYFDMGNIKSGENPVKKSGTDCQDIIGFISDITERSHEMSSYSFTSLFSLQIADENIGLTFYDIYVTDLNAVVITRHDGETQARTAYGVSGDDYEALLHILFLQFGQEDDYELFRSLISGK